MTDADLAPAPDPRRASSPAVLRALLRFHRRRLELTSDRASRAEIEDSIREAEAILAEKMAERKEIHDV